MSATSSDAAGFPRQPWGDNITQAGMPPIYAVAYVYVARAQVSGGCDILGREAPCDFCCCKTLHLFAVMCFITLLGLLGTRLLPLNPIKKSTLATIGLLLSLRLAALQSDVVKSRNLLLS